MPATTHTEPTALFYYDDVAQNDEFGRRPFAECLARIIMDEPLGKPLVVSIVSPWGSGKSTMLEYVKDAIAATTRDESPNVKTCRITSFCPWRYAGEDNLLYHLFETLIKAINHEDDVLTAWQRIMRRIPEWIKPTSLAFDFCAPGAGKLLDGFFSAISPTKFKVHLESVRHQTKEYLEKNGVRVVMLMDDVDRLDPDDILLLFRALKLIADMPNTTFIIAMDEDLVSKVIGRKIDGRTVTGRSYIEKIVNVRLNLPIIPSYIMAERTLEKLGAVWEQTKGKMSTKDAQRTRDIFLVLHAPFITTPRTVKSLQNAYSFALRLLGDAVNPGDVLLIEATRLLHDKLYKTIQEVIPSLGRISDSYVALLTRQNKGAARAKKTEVMNKLLASFGSIRSDQQEDIKGCLKDWFPQLGDSMLNEEEQDWSHSRRVCSKDYFWRYFSWTIQKDDVHDAQITNWLLNNIENSEKAGEALRSHFTQAYAQAFLKKLHDQLSEGQKNVTPHLITLAKISASLVEQEGNRLIGNISNDAARIIGQLIRQQGTSEKRLEIALAVIRESGDLKWNFALSDHFEGAEFFTYRQTESGEQKPPSKFDEELAEQSIAAYEGNRVPQSNDMICHFVWSIFRNHHLPNMKSKVLGVVNSNPNAGLQFLVGGCTFGSSESHKAACWRWNGKDGLHKVVVLIPLETLKSVLNKALPSSLPEVRIPRHDFDYQTLEEVGAACLETIKNLDQKNNSKAL